MDIVEELGFWLGNDPEPGMFLLLQRARDEIVGLRGENVVLRSAVERVRGMLCELARVGDAVPPER